MDLLEVAMTLQKFSGAGLTATLGRIESELRGMSASQCTKAIASAGAEREVLVAAAALKRVAGQVNVAIHALGILLCLPHILETGEAVEYVSLGAGNTGRQFDLETDRRIAEFKFIQWRGGPESIRQNSLFKDFFLLTDSPAAKRKYLYVLGTTHALRFLNGGRALNSVLSRNVALKEHFRSRFDDRFQTVGDYFRAHKDKVALVDVSAWVPELIADAAAQEFGSEDAEAGIALSEDQPL